MNYSEASKYLFDQLPMYQRVGGAAYKPDMGNTEKILEKLGNPHQDIKMVHVAGTNGKGSVSHMLASVFQEAGYKTGLYTSPHLVDYAERIKVNGKCIDKEFVAGFISENMNYFEEIKPSFFEISVALSFAWFKEMKTDICFIETGLGGRLDSTNVIHPVLSVITNVSMDHCHFLGDNVESIAGEKAGIIKKEIQVLIGEYQEEIAHVFINKAKALSAPLLFARDFLQIELVDQSNDEKDFRAQYVEGRFLTFRTNLMGNYQIKNFRTSLGAIELLKEQFPVSEENIIVGFNKVYANTGLKGRWQKINDIPVTICDVAHNYAGLGHVICQLQTECNGKIHFILGFVSDKDVAKIVELFPKDAYYYFTEPVIPRKMSCEETRKHFNRKKIKGEAIDSISEAYEKALDRAMPEDYIYIGGSAFVVSEILEKI